ncbi:hypothetical protein [Ornithinimicrobium cerasi]|uniref:hypothetical protein n=1 Tax=Ornithinimicrobium cerasi TaxID=2248773 RepID=UPI000F00F0BA|nr:hypothetical protein [Ornithinimicrobium cerasi]
MGAALSRVGRSVLGALAVVLEGLRLLVAHWPVLVVVLLLGAVARELVLWASFELSKVSPVAATITAALAPLSAVAALVVALRVVMPSLRNVPEATGLTRSRRLSVLASALVPFLAVYASQGYLREDVRRFVNEVTADEFRSTNWFIETAGARTLADVSLPVTAAVVVGALVLRWGLDRFDLAQRNLGLGLLAAWVEALWLVTVAKTISTGWEGAWAWVLGRRGVAWLMDGWAAAMGVLGPAGTWFDSAVSWLWDLLGDFDTLVVVPLAWLVVGAVVYGRELAEPRDTDLSRVGVRVVGAIRDERALARLERARQRSARVRARASRLPVWLREWAAAPVTSVTERFAALGRGLLTLLRAGLVPMVTLCLVLILARHAGVAVAILLRAVVGPMDAEWGRVVAPYVSMGLNLVTTLLMVVLIAAAVDRFLARPAQETADAAGTPVASRT